MPAHRINWNPQLYDWTTQGLEDQLVELREKGSTVKAWSIGPVKAPKIGERIFLFRVGSVPKKGLVGVGTIVREAYPQLHWDAARAAAGDEVNYIDVRFTHLAEEPLLSAEELSDPQFDPIRRSRQSPCISIPDEVADAIVARL